MKLPSIRIGIIALLVGVLAIAPVACNGTEDTAEPISPPTQAAPEPAEEEEEVPAGVVLPKPADARQVNVTLAEWSIVPDVQTIPSGGAVYFLAENVGPVDPHELVIVRSDLPADGLPVVDGKVDESVVEVIGEIEEFAINTSASGVFDLEPGNYILICNIAEIEEGELESHYEEGMAVAFTVESSAEDEVPAGIVNPRPAGAQQVDVILAEWSIVPSVQSIPAGQTYFLAENVGPDDPHELVIVRSDLPADGLPVVDGKVDESVVEVIGEIEEFARNTSASGVFDLEPGNYILICNIAEIEEGELESHYEEGMAVAFTVEASADEEEEVPAGVVLPRPAGAQQVDVILAEWSIVPSVQSVPAGLTYFLTENVGPVDPHELVIVKTDLPADSLPVVDGKVDESAVDVIGEIEEYAVNTSASGVFDLEPGNYVLICNITEIEDGELESHYEEGMAIAFTVT